MKATKEASMTNEEKMSLLKKIHLTLFTSKQTGTDITKERVLNPYITNTQAFGRWFSDNTLRGFDVSIDLGTRVIDIRCVEQNPNKMDAKGNLKWTANLARQVHKIMWVIDRNGGFLGRMQDDEWIPGFEPAIQPAIQNAPAQTDVPYVDPNKSYGQDLADSLNIGELSEIPNAADIPEYVLQSVAEMEEEPPDWDGDY
jgi:hypothetical protein